MAEEEDTKADDENDEDGGGEEEDEGERKPVRSDTGQRSSGPLARFNASEPTAKTIAAWTKPVRDILAIILAIVAILRGLHYLQERDEKERQVQLEISAAQAQAQQQAAVASNAVTVLFDTSRPSTERAAAKGYLIGLDAGPLATLVQAVSTDAPPPPPSPTFVLPPVALTAAAAPPLPSHATAKIVDTDLSAGQSQVVILPRIAGARARYTINLATSLPCSRSACAPPTGPGSNCWCNSPASARVDVSVGGRTYPLEYANETPNGWIGTTAYRYERILSGTTEAVPQGDVTLKVVSTSYVGSPPLRIGGTISVDP